MSRVIKFRAWDGKAMNYDPQFYGSCGDGECSVNEEFQDTLGDGLVFMQFTGLLDKNGKEIYEGDIVEIDGFYRVQASIGWLAVDAYDVYGVNIHGGYHESKDHGTGKRIQSEIELIGNIHQNQELLS